MSNIVVKPRLRKTFVKGLIAIAVISALLEVNTSNFAHYLIFLAVSMSLLLVYMAVKHSYTYIIGEEGVAINSAFARKSFSYENIADLYVSQGALARKFHCGTVYMIIKNHPGNTSFRTHVEALRDVTDPRKIYGEIESRLSQISGYAERNQLS